MELEPYNHELNYVFFDMSKPCSFQVYSEGLEVQNFKSIDEGEFSRLVLSSVLYTLVRSYSEFHSLNMTLTCMFQCKY